MFGDFTETEYLNYFTTRFPRLLVHCYSSVENEARDLLEEYFHKDEAPAVPLTGIINTPDLQLEGSKLNIKCRDVITFPDTKVMFDTLKIDAISHLFIKGKKSFTNFLQNNGSAVTQLTFTKGTLKFDSMNKILQKLPNLQIIQFECLSYETPKKKTSIHTATCPSLVELKVTNRFNSSLLEAFQECATIQKLTLSCSELPLHILQKYSGLEELTVEFSGVHSVSEFPKLSSSSIKQLNVLNISFYNLDDEVLECLFDFIRSQDNLQKFSLNYNSLSQSFCKQLVAHIFNLKHLASLEINESENLLKEVESYVANFPVAITYLDELPCQLRYIQSLALLFPRHSITLMKLDIDCWLVGHSKIYEDWIGSISKTSTKSESFQWLFKFKIEFWKIEIFKYSQDIQHELLPKHPNITHIVAEYLRKYDERKSLELIPMLVRVFANVERLVVIVFKDIRVYSETNTECVNRIE